MRLPLIITTLVLALVAVSCAGGMAGDFVDDGDYLLVEVDSVDSATRGLDLLGPTDATLLTVEYFIYGTNEDYGDDNPVPFSSLRLDETRFGPLAYGEEQLNIDLSPWAGYPYIYVRHLGALPNIAHRLEADKYYQISAYVPASD